MYIKKRYPLLAMLHWTRREIFIFLIISIVPTFLYQVLDIHWIQIPWAPIAVIGTAVAFVIGFQNNAVYERAWEARKIWGGIVNSSRTWTMLIKDMVTSRHSKKPVDDSEIEAHIKTMVHRHVAWLTALRHAMREPRIWEVLYEEKSNREWQDNMFIPEKKHELTKDLKPYLSPSEYEYVMAKKSKPSTILSLQSQHLRRLVEKDLVWEFSFLELEKVLISFFELQGKTERIKNFPYPRQYATLNHVFVWIFIFLLPLAIIPEFSRVGGLVSQSSVVGLCFTWFSVPFTAVISWIFHTMERIGRAGENPFEGSPNDIPISSISRGIEIDIRQMIDEDEKDIPKPFPVMNFVQM